MALSKSQESEYTWQEVAEHNTEDSAWVYCDGIVYDVTEFLHKHPGGRDMLLLFAGRDISTVVPMYHPFTEQPRKIMPGMRIGKLKGVSEHGSFDKEGSFYRILRQRVGDLFERRGIDPKDPRPGLVNMAALLTGMYSSWWFAWSSHSSSMFLIRIAAMIIAGLFQGMLLMHTMHDCSHCALTHRPWVWKWIGRLCLDFGCGSSLDAWMNQHVVGHHTYTNILTKDPDCPAEFEYDLRRIMPSQQWSRLHTYQHIWLPLLYCLLSFKARVQDLTETLIRGMNGAMRVNPISNSTEATIVQVLAKSSWLIRQVLLPLLVFRMDVLKEWLPLMMAMELSSGFLLAFNFQVSHVSTNVEWPMLDENGARIPCEWAEMQVACSVDYSHDSEWNTLMSGALNYQSIHHLFPSVSQYHYPLIAPIVRQTCKEFALEFHHLPTFMDAFSAHVSQLYRMSFAPQP